MAGRTSRHTTSRRPCSRDAVHLAVMGLRSHLDNPQPSVRDKEPSQDQSRGSHMAGPALAGDQEYTAAHTPGVRSGQPYRPADRGPAIANVGASDAALHFGGYGEDRGRGSDPDAPGAAKISGGAGARACPAEFTPPAVDKGRLSVVMAHSEASGLRQAYARPARDLRYTPLYSRIYGSRDRRCDWLDRAPGGANQSEICRPRKGRKSPRGEACGELSLHLECKLRFSPFHKCLKNGADWETRTPDLMITNRHAALFSLNLCGNQTPCDLLRPEG